MRGIRYVKKLGLVNDNDELENHLSFVLSLKLQLKTKLYIQLCGLEV